MNVRKKIKMKEQDKMRDKLKEMEQKQLEKEEKEEIKENKELVISRDQEKPQTKATEIEIVQPKVSTTTASVNPSKEKPNENTSLLKTTENIPTTGAIPIPKPTEENKIACPCSIT